MNKRQKRFVSAVCIVLAVLMALSVIMMVIPAQAVSASDLEELQSQREALGEELERQAAVVQSLEDSNALIIERKAALDHQIALNREDIRLLEEEIALYDLRIEEKEQELAQAQAAEEAQTRVFRERLRAAEEKGESSYLDFLFAATSFSDLLSRLGDVSDLMNYDRDLEDALRQTRGRVEDLMAEYESIQAEKSGIHQELIVRQNQLNAQIQAAAELIRRLTEMGDEAREEYAAIEAAERKAAQEEAEALARLAAEQEARRRAEEVPTPAPAEIPAPADPGEQPAPAPADPGEQPAPGYGGTYEATYDDNVDLDDGSFIWPVDSKYITSLYGERDAPTAGASTYHGAIDIGATAGSPIYAVADGEVAIATYNDGLGNYVSIAHDGDTSTRYSHMTEFIVQPGEHVTQGQIIGYVGQTGIATGDHLDFAVIEGGQAVDPLQFYDTSGLTFDPTA